MKYQLQLLLLLGVLFPTGSKSTGSAVGCEDKAPVYFSGIFPGMGMAVPGFEALVFKDAGFATIDIGGGGGADGNILYKHKAPVRTYAVSVAGVLLVAAAFFRISRKRMMLALFIMLGLLSAIIVCYRGDRAIGSSGPVRFVRIAVTDKKGVRSYSEVMRVYKVLEGKIN